MKTNYILVYTSAEFSYFWYGSRGVIDNASDQLMIDPLEYFF